MSTQTDVPEERRVQDPHSLRLRSISPSLTVNDLRASLAWYRDTVGFSVEQAYEHEGQLRGVALMAGNARLMLSQDDGAKGSDRTKGVGHRLYMTTAQDVDEIAGAIKGRGGTLASEPADMPWGARAFNLVDLDGFQLTITSEG